MKTAFSIDDPREEAGVLAALDAYNNRPGQSEDNTPLTADEFILASLRPLLIQWGDNADVATTDDRKKLEDAILADPVAVKRAIEAKRAKEAQTAQVAQAEVIMEK